MAVNHDWFNVCCPHRHASFLETDISAQLARWEFFNLTLRDSSGNTFFSDFQIICCWTGHETRSTAKAEF